MNRGETVDTPVEHDVGIGRDVPRVALISRVWRTGGEVVDAIIRTLTHEVVDVHFKLKVLGKLDRCHRRDVDHVGRGEPVGICINQA
ncbi:hypothetical protein D3C78_1602000 [compost metagenome]